MRIVIAVIAIAMLTTGAYAQGMGKGGKNPQQTEQKTDDQDAKKASDAAYKKALKVIPAASEKPDPWKNVR
jgi:hypothetical protein